MSINLQSEEMKQTIARRSDNAAHIISTLGKDLKRNFPDEETYRLVFKEIAQRMDADGRDFLVKVLSGIIRMDAGRIIDEERDDEE